jgi:hypothetical protein
MVFSVPNRSLLGNGHRARCGPVSTANMSFGIGSSHGDLYQAQRMRSQVVPKQHVGCGDGEGD